MVKQKFSLKQNIRINQKININIINAIKILQMSVSEVGEFTRKEIDKNPFLLAPNPLHQTNDFSILENQSKNLNIKEWLYQQSSFLSINIVNERLIESYIENLDNFGFCKITPKDAAILTNTSEGLANTILIKLKLLDPIGIFSSDLKEHLTTQLKKMHLFNSKYKIILDNLNHLASSNLNQLSKLCKVDISEINLMIKNIKTLKPRPLDNLEEEKIERLIPDIIVKIHKKKINLKLFSEDSYKVILNEKYIKEIKIKLLNLPNDETKDYIKKCIAHGKSLQNNLNRRNKTLVLVANKILNIQKDFFFKGEESILPLTHKNISEKISMHESTISRAVKNKYIKYNNKTLPLNYFFNSKIINSSNNTNTSSASIKNKIKNLIDSEKNINNIYSDQKITEILNKAEINISRRTVTKYRESLKISNSVKRSKNL